MILGWQFYIPEADRQNFIDNINSLVSEDVTGFSKGFEAGISEAQYRERAKETGNEIAKRMIDKYLSSCMVDGMRYIEIPKSIRKLLDWLGSKEGVESDCMGA